VNPSEACVGDVPYLFVTVTLAVPAPSGLTHVIVDALTTTTDVALREPKFTAVAPVRCLPVIVTGVPPFALPLVGDRLVTLGAK
jgi:hypothetical protein